MTATATNTASVRIRITRRDKPDSAPYQQEFEVPQRPQANVISGLLAIAAKPVTVDGRQTTPVVWDSNCLEEVCGACTMVVNGKVRQSCSTLVHELVEAGYGTPGNPITLEP